MRCAVTRVLPDRRRSRSQHALPPLRHTVAFPEPSSSQAPSGEPTGRPGSRDGRSGWGGPGQPRRPSGAPSGRGVRPVKYTGIEAGVRALVRDAFVAETRARPEGCRIADLMGNRVVRGSVRSVAQRQTAARPALLLDAWSRSLGSVAATATKQNRRPARWHRFSCSDLGESDRAATGPSRVCSDDSSVVA